VQILAEMIVGISVVRSRRRPLRKLMSWMASGTVASIQILALRSVVVIPGRSRKALRVEAPAALEVPTGATEILTIVTVVRKVAQNTVGATLAEREKAQVKSSGGLTRSLIHQISLYILRCHNRDIYSPPSPLIPGSTVHELVAADPSAKDVEDPELSCHSGKPCDKKVQSYPRVEQNSLEDVAHGGTLEKCV
jgi:hypothetical protein